MIFSFIHQRMIDHVLQEVIMTVHLHIYPYINIIKTESWIIFAHKGNIGKLFQRISTIITVHQKLECKKNPDRKNREWSCPYIH